MKKILFVLSWFLIFMHSCSDNEVALTVPDENAPEINLPKKSETYGKTVARELRGIALSFSEKGIDYTKANTSPSINKQVIAELYKDVPAIAKIKTSTVFTFESVASPRNFAALTDDQQKLVYKILDEYKNSKSDSAFFEKLKIINREIYALPPIEQERIFNLSAALYYGLKEVDNLRKEGLMAPTGLSSSNRYRLKSFSENGDGSDGGEGECKQIESVTAIAVGFEVFLNGAKHVVQQTV